MVSFKVKLVAWFALVALLPLAVTFYGYAQVTKRSEQRRVDAVLQAALRAAVAGYAARLDAATADAQTLAARAELQAAMRRHDRVAIERVAPGAIVDVGGLRVGTAPPVSAVRRVAVFDRGRLLGHVGIAVSIDDRLLRSLGGGLSPGDRLVALRRGTVVAGPMRGAAFGLRPGQAELVGDYRGVATSELPASPGVSFAALAPEAAISDATSAAEQRLFAALVASLIMFAIVTYVLGRSIVVTLRRLAAAANALAAGHLRERVEVRGTDEFAQLGSAFNRMAAQLEQRLAELETERTRVREATARFGEALAATHDSGQLVRVVVESAVEATGASGGVVIGRHGEVARAGDPDAAAERIAFPLRLGSSDFGSLVLAAPSFDADQVETAASLAAQVVVALENARLHRIVERQALVDSLTGLANRRSLEETLRVELARAARYGESVTVVLADLDDFKLVNDTYGHQAGDEVLKAFASTLRSTVRESDVAGRWGGEEFALVLAGTDSVGAARLAERARRTIEEREVRMPNGDLVTVTASFGVASFPETAELGEVLAAADSALYAAKREGKNRVVVSPESART
jgi:two-component system cell cycle response regulator